MKKKLLTIVLGASLALTVGACGKKEESKPSSSGQGASADSAEKVFQKSCAGCHGNDLQGLSGPALQKVGGKYGKEDIEKIITKGRGAMPAGLIQGEDAKKVAEWLAEKK
ncbi:cytochrome c [Bacillus sp. JJ864]|uniref:cytochrome c551 n=1 Tax=Bacillus sp. JJ864 TaxID=3122975 RepID=UPI002FFDDE34